MDISVNWVDVSVVVALLVGASIGLFQGLVRQIVFVLIAYVSVVLAAQYHFVVADMLEHAFPMGHPTAISLVALGLVFILSCIALNVLTFFLFHSRAVPAVEAVDHLGGAALGTLSTWLILSFIVGIVSFSLAVPWLGWEQLERDVEIALQSSLFRQSLRSTLPLLSEAIKPWFPSGLPALLFV